MTYPNELRSAETFIEHSDDWLSWPPKLVAYHVVFERISFHLAPKSYVSDSNHILQEQQLWTLKFRSFILMPPREATVGKLF